MVATVSSLLVSLLPQIVSGAGVGFVGGWLVKKVAKIVMYVAVGFVGLIGAAVALVESWGWISVTVHWDVIAASTQATLATAASSLSLTSILASVTAFSGPATIAFALGLKRG